VIVTIDATSALLRSAGIKSYTYHLVRALRRIAEADEIRAYPYLKDFGALDHEASTLSRFATLSRIGALYLSRSTPLLDLMLAGSDVFHASNQVRRAPRGVKLTATIHDLTCWLIPELHTEANVRADRTFAEQILRRADGLIAVSENTRQDAIRMLGIAPEKIETIYSGVAEEYFNAKPSHGLASRRERPYVLYVGTIEPRKNLDVLLDAWKLLRTDCELVIAGPEGWGSEATLARIRAEATYLGYVPEADLPALVAGATIFVYPSLYEGFGFPVVQAMAAGVPVVTSNTSCLPEIAGDAAVLAHPRSASEIAGGLKRLLDSESQREQFAARGRERAQMFKWETCAARSLAFFRRVAG
jgi:glycosyltransferase involved in cell wall biosynthesis